MDHFSMLKDMDKNEMRILTAIEVSMRKFEWVPFNNVVFHARMEPKMVLYWLDKVHKRDLIIRQSGKVEAYVLNSKGYDLLALHTLAERGVIASIGNSMGVGKESDIYQALTPAGDRVALKFHRIGRTSFRNVRRTRDYLDGSHHGSWLYTCRLSATREAENLALLMPLGVDTPELIDHNRHVIVMKLYEGQEIQEFAELANPKQIFECVLWNVRRIYHEAHLIHGDLGEYNILYMDSGDIVIIDWPQAIATSHPNAKEILTRDIGNVCTFFRRYGIESDADAIVSGIIEKKY
jgi:RIO kinase 2